MFRKRHPVCQLLPVWAAKCLCMLILLLVKDLQSLAEILCNLWLHGGVVLVVSQYVLCHLLSSYLQMIVCVCACMRVWRPEVNLEYHPSGDIHTDVFKVGSSTGSRHSRMRVDWLVSEL